MNDDDHIDRSKTTFEGGRREQLRRARAITFRQRLEALDELTDLSERIQAMRHKTGKASGKNERRDTHGGYSCSRKGHNGVF